MTNTPPAPPADERPLDPSLLRLVEAMARAQARRDLETPTKP